MTGYWGDLLGLLIVILAGVGVGRGLISISTPGERRKLFYAVCATGWVAFAIHWASHAGTGTSW